jgi:hypothetical protein
MRRTNGYAIAQVIWEFALFRTLLREALEEVAPAEPPANLFVARELILAIIDRSEVGSVQQYIEEISRERDLAREAV